MTKSFLIPTLLPEGEGLAFPRPPGEGPRVREGFAELRLILYSRTPSDCIGLASRARHGFVQALGAHAAPSGLNFHKRRNPCAPAGCTAGRRFHATRKFPPAFVTAHHVLSRNRMGERSDHALRILCRTNSTTPGMIESTMMPSMNSVRLFLTSGRLPK